MKAVPWFAAFASLALGIVYLIGPDDVGRATMWFALATFNYVVFLGTEKPK